MPSQGGDPLAIEVRGVEKTFRVPTHRIDSLKERVVHPFARPEYRTLHALRGVSFDVRRGEFFGIVGRNGSGKSTLLKILASIYRADAGTIRMAGRPAPFIELGVGFNPELTARENVVLNGVMMGLSQREARRKLDTVLEFAELEEFVDMKLKNYSSGMLVRLAFSVMLEADTEILLIDEVLAVGDASFQQKCRDVFHEMKRGDRTVVLVTHDMTAVQTYCDRAMLLEDGGLSFIGDPEEAGRQYLRMNFEREPVSPGDRGEMPMVTDFLARPVEAWLEDLDGERVTNVEAGSPIRLHAVMEARRELENPRFTLHVNNADGVGVFSIGGDLGDGERGAALEVGRHARVSATLENPLMPGRYVLVCWVGVLRNDEEVAHQAIKLLDFVVFGVARGHGVVVVPGEVGVQALEEAEEGGG
ncbi:MAG: transporter related protein [Solirubrobacterales bacterium]|jgi:ABC-type polysaccharide/polyol phosphate transport system ATPase subunit|nr:transporter related protein [Solirubrobacterales bacterium]